MLSNLNAAKSAQNRSDSGALDSHPFESADEEDEEYGFEHFDNFEPPIDEENGLMLRRQRLFRWAAQASAVASVNTFSTSGLAAFGAVAQPLPEEVPWFRQF